MEINTQTLYRYLLFDDPIIYNEYITLHPIKMKDILLFQTYQSAFTLRKDSIFKSKSIIKMSYFDFIKYAYQNLELEHEYNIALLSCYYDFILNTFQTVCQSDAKITYNPETLQCFINGYEISDTVFNDLRKIIMIQNDIDFDEEFMNIDTLKALEKANHFEEKKRKEKANLEDYIDSLIVDLGVTEDYVKNLTIRKFWRYIKRINKHEEYQSCRSAQMSGFVTFKEPLQHWMTNIDSSDKYSFLKANEKELKDKIF